MNNTEAKPATIPKAWIRAFTPLSMPLVIYPLSRSTKEMTKGTPGTKNNTLVAKACSGLEVTSSFQQNTMTKAAKNALNYVMTYGFSLIFINSCFRNNPLPVAKKTLPISL